MNNCTITDCKNLKHRSQLCGKHEWRKYKYGDPNYVKWPRHGDDGSVEHGTWSSIKARCSNPNHPKYKDYGGRGIKVCKRWTDSYILFLEDMGRKPSPNHSIERIKNDGDYEPSNCRWATINEQAVNKRNNNDVAGVCYTNQYKRWLATLKVDGKYVLRKTYKTKQEAIAARLEAETMWLNSQ